MRLTKSENHDQNYLAAIVECKELRPHSNADKLAVMTVFGNDCIVGVDTKIGDVFVYFPLECQISAKLLSDLNLFSSQLLNKDTEKKGYFDQNRRVKAVRLRGERSAGFLLKADSFAEFLGVDVATINKEVGVEFDVIDGNVICNKYIAGTQKQSGSNDPKEKINKQDTIVKRLLPNQFRFHYDTAHLGRNLHLVSPDSLISVSEKLHGMNAIYSNVLVRPIVRKRDRLAKLLGVNVVSKAYQFLYSSRSVVKSGRDGSIGSDQWGLHAKELVNKLPPGYTVYGELVGFTPNGGAIQKHYDYGCEPSTSKFTVFRVTYTDPVGEVLELSVLDIIRFCNKYSLETVPYHYIGKAGDMFPCLSAGPHWNERFLKQLEQNYLDKPCKLCKGSIANEGIVLAIEDKVNRPVFKFKSFSFLQKESKNRDSGIEEEN